MGIYENRLGCGCNKPVEPKKEPTPVIPVIPDVPTKPVEPEKPISPKCWLVKPTHIVRVGDKVFITLDDCSYMEADASILDAGICKGMEEDLSKLQEKVKALSEELGKKANTEEVNESLNSKANKTDLDAKANKEDLANAVTALDTKADKSALDNKADKADVDTLKEKVTALEEKTKVLDTLEDISYSDGNVSFRAFPKQ